MVEVKSHLEGTPCWAELSTTDEKGALKFYSGLFGWKDNPQPMGPGMYYHMQQLRGLDAAALYQQMPEEKAQGVPSHWRMYFAVKSADEIAKKAKQAGGKVLMEPMDVFDSGRMAMIQDPQGAMFGVWQPKKHVGYRIMGETGAVAWNEVITTDPKGAAAFYSKTLGVAANEVPGMDYTMMRAGGQDAAGAMKIKPEMGPVPPHWMVYFAVADVKATIKKAQSLGGKALMPAQDIPGQGTFAVLQDPQGAVFAIFKSSRQAPGQAR